MHEHHHRTASAAALQIVVILASSLLVPDWASAQQSVTTPRTAGPSAASVLPLDQLAEGYRAMDERRAIKALLLP